ncbi:unnamed protein product, partial [Prorocentrum cordatum]
MPGALRAMPPGARGRCEEARRRLAASPLPAALRLLLLSAAAAAMCRFGARAWIGGGAAAVRRGQGGSGRPRERAGRVVCLAISERPPPPKPPRERRMSQMEKQADAIVHAVVAVELLDWHGKLTGGLEHAFRKCVYTPVMPRLLRLTTRERSAFDDYRSDQPGPEPWNGRKISRPSRVHDATLERQFTLGNIFTMEALSALSRTDEGKWLPQA